MVKDLCIKNIFLTDFVSTEGFLLFLDCLELDFTVVSKESSTIIISSDRLEWSTKVKESVKSITSSQLAIVLGSRKRYEH